MGGTQRVKCKVHSNFRLVLIAEKQKVYETFEVPLINRMEKYYVTMETVLDVGQVAMKDELTNWVEKIVKANSSSTEEVNVIHQIYNLDMSRFTYSFFVCGDFSWFSVFWCNQMC